MDRNNPNKTLVYVVKMLGICFHRFEGIWPPHFLISIVVIGPVLPYALWVSNQDSYELGLSTIIAMVIISAFTFILANKLVGIGMSWKESVLEEAKVDKALPLFIFVFASYSTVIFGLLYLINEISINCC